MSLMKNPRKDIACKEEHETDKQDSHHSGYDDNNRNLEKIGVIQSYF